MNEAETRAELIDPKFTQSGWGVDVETKILREFHITKGKIQSGGKRTKPLIADYILTYKNIKLAVVEAKSDELEVGEGVAQAKNYALKLNIVFAYSTNGKEIYQINIDTGKEELISNFPNPKDLWNKTFPKSTAVGELVELAEEWSNKFTLVPYEDISGTKPLRFYQEIAVNKVLNAITKKQSRILLTLATGTGKTFIAFQIVWKLFYSRWNLKFDGSRRPRILFLADRNILADQAFNAFNPFPDDALVRITPGEVNKKGRVPTNGSIFFTIFQSFMSGTDELGQPKPHFGQYPPDYFDFIIIDECHRGGANDESSWREIMNYFSPAFQLGLTATPKRAINVDTYLYFGEPVYIYSLKEGINDGFLTPFRVKRIQTTIDDYLYTSDDTVLEGEVENGKIYKESDFNRIIEIKAREEKRVKLFLAEIDQNEKTIVFCANQPHAALIRDFINQNKTSTDAGYCQRVTANDGKLGEQHLRDFQDNEKTIPTILTTSHKLSTGVDARNIRNITLLRPINSMIEFKQIIGRGTRLFEGKEYFTIYDYVNAYHHFADPEWDGEPVEPEPNKVNEPRMPYEPKEYHNSTGEDKVRPKKIKIKLSDGKEREIQSMMSTFFFTADGTPISSEEFLYSLYGKLPEFFKDEDELRNIWSNPTTRKSLLQKLEEAGFDIENLKTLQKLINAEKSDLFDVLEYVAFVIKPISREERVEQNKTNIFNLLNEKQSEFINFVLEKYIQTGVEELDQDKLPTLLELKYHSIADAAAQLGGVEDIKNTFINFQKHLYGKEVA